MAAWPKRILAPVLSILLEHRSPRRISVALALGVFIGSSPLWGFHTLLAIALSIILGLNKPAVVFGTMVSNPLFAPFLILLSLEAGSWFLYGRGAHPSLLEIKELVQNPKWQQVFDEYLLPYCVGSVVVGLVLAVCSFWIALWIARSYRTEEQ